MHYRITITGDLGSGKSTICRLIQTQAGIGSFSTGAIQRRLAEQHKMTTTELNIYMETRPEMDGAIDDELVRMASEMDDFIIDSRMAWHFVPHTFKVYLSVDPNIAAARILADERGAAETYDSLESAVQQLSERKASENLRYQLLYGVDCQDFSNFDLVIDTSNMTSAAVAEKLLNEYQLWQKKHQV